MLHLAEPGELKEQVFVAGRIELDERLGFRPAAFQTQDASFAEFFVKHFVVFAERLIDRIIHRC